MTLIERLRAGTTEPTQTESVIRVAASTPIMIEAADRIAALVDRCKAAERIICTLADDLGERGPPETKADAGSAEFEAWREDLGKWMQAMMEARVYFEVYDGPSPKAFDLDRM